MLKGYRFRTKGLASLPQRHIHLHIGMANEWLDGRTSFRTDFALRRRGGEWESELVRE